MNRRDFFHNLFVGIVAAPIAIKSIYNEKNDKKNNEINSNLKSVPEFSGNYYTSNFNGVYYYTPGVPFLSSSFNTNRPTTIYLVGNQIK